MKLIKKNIDEIDDIRNNNKHRRLYNTKRLYTSFAHIINFLKQEHTIIISGWVDITQLSLCHNGG